MNNYTISGLYGEKKWVENLEYDFPTDDWNIEFTTNKSKAYVTDLDEVCKIAKQLRKKGFLEVSINESNKKYSNKWKF